MRRLIKGLFSRTTITILFVAAEVLVMLALSFWVGEKFAWIAVVMRIAGVLVLLYINMHTQHLSFDMIWIIGVVVLPVSVTALYFLLGTTVFKTNTYKSIVAGEAEMWKYLEQDDDVLEELYRSDPARKGQFRYISKGSGYPFYENESFDYYPFGEDGYPAMLEELRKAEKFIFVEYFIIEKGEMWNGIVEILEEKAAAGVDVRVIYDDMGSFRTLPIMYTREMEEKNIKCKAFNRISPVLAKIMNHRDHRKILVIDGKVAFSGGVNLADEYINKKVKYGKWKDNIIRVKGKAVWSFTVMFLSHWNAVMPGADDDYTVFSGDGSAAEEEIYTDKTGRAYAEDIYEPELNIDADISEKLPSCDGYIAPYGETPLDSEITSQNIYMNILNQANDYVYIFTPYLIIDSELQNALILAAKRGVDVRLITPGIPDKKRIWKITRSFYPNLIKGGVKIYEYQPGFVHAKVFVSDDEVAVIGTINLDYRSLYLHFENGVFLYGSSKIDDVKRDLTGTLEECRLITLKDLRESPFYMFRVSVLRLFAPLL